MKFFSFHSRKNHVWVKQKYLLSFFSKTKLAYEQDENNFFLPTQLIWEIFQFRVRV
jgi:hypothetical protein